MGDSKCQHHLALPKWNGIYNGCLDFFYHKGVIVLHQTNLRCCLQGNGSGQFQIMQLLLETIALTVQILGFLRILRKSADCCFCLQIF